MINKCGYIFGDTKDSEKLSDPDPVRLSHSTCLESSSVCGIPEHIWLCVLRPVLLQCVQGVCVQHARRHARHAQHRHKEDRNVPLQEGILYGANMSRHSLIKTNLYNHDINIMSYCI